LLAKRASIDNKDSEDRERIAIDMAPNRDTDRTPRGHDLTLLEELQEFTPAERIARNCAMAEWTEKLREAVQDHATRSDLPKPRE
jgi:hypothetical protein